SKRSTQSPAPDPNSREPRKPPVLCIDDRERAGTTFTRMRRFFIVNYVFIHGGGSTARFWDRLLPYVDRPALAVDLPGRNGKPADFATLSVDDEVASALADDTLAFVVDSVRCVADTVHHYFQPVHWSVAASVPVTYLLNTRDRPVPAEMQEQMVTHLPRAPHVIRLDSGHIPAVTDPVGF